MEGGRDLFNINIKEGIIINNTSADRVFFLGAQGWSSLIEKLHGTFGSAAEVILFDLGKFYGRSLIERKKDSHPRPNLDLFSREATVAGWGKVSASGGSPENVMIKNQNCVFCAESKDPDRKGVGCLFFKGVLSSLSEVLLGTSGDVEETHCGRDCCEFAMRLS